MFGANPKRDSPASHPFPTQAHNEKGVIVKHELKTRLPYFKAAWAGVKPFEIRNNDRKFELHDEIVLQEYNHYLTEANGAYTGREIFGFITYITDYEQKDGYVVFSYSESHRVDG